MAVVCVHLMISVQSPYNWWFEDGHHRIHSECVTFCILIIRCTETFWSPCIWRYKCYIRRYTVYINVFVHWSRRQGSWKCWTSVLADRHHTVTRHTWSSHHSSLHRSNQFFWPSRSALYCPHWREILWRLGRREITYVTVLWEHKTCFSHVLRVMWNNGKYTGCSAHVRSYELPPCLLRRGIDSLSLNLYTDYRSDARILKWP
jgi:hypothetical protein